MKTSKLIILNLLVLATMICSAFMYFKAGLAPFALTKEYALSMWKAPAMLGFLFFVSMFVNLAFIVRAAGKKKNLLRIPLFFLVIVFVVQIVYTILDIVNQVYDIASWIQLLLTLLLIILNIIILVDLHKLIKQLVQRKV